jgi:PhoH-like ATPase
LPFGLSGRSSDNALLGITLDLGKSHPDRQSILVTKDINLRLKARALGILAEDYTNDQVLDDANLLYTGMEKLDGDFWETHSKKMESWKEEGRTFYRLRGPKARAWIPNLFIFTNDQRPFEALVRRIENDAAVIEVVQDYASERNKVWGISARNREQNFSLNLLMNPEIDFVTLLGQAGTGKTLLTLASALMQTLEIKRYTEIIMTRMTVPVGEDIGFLPGTEEEKMGPWMGALEDNLDVLQETATHEHGAWGRAATHDLLRNRIRIKSLNFMRGRTFLKKFLIIDEAQNLSPHQIKTLVTRAGPGSKIVCLGNIAQIDTPYLTETTSGLTYVVDRFKTWEHSGHVTLQRGERSRLADHATEIL